MSKYAFLSKLPHKSTNISSTPKKKNLYTQETVNPKIWTQKNTTSLGTGNVCEYPSGLPLWELNI